MSLRRRRLDVLAFLLSAGSLLSGCASLPNALSRKPVMGTSQQMFARGAAAERQGQWDQARWAYQHAVRLDASSAQAWHRLAVVSTWQKDHVQAANSFNQALRLAPTDPELLTDAGYACFLRQEYPAAEQLYVAALQQDPAHHRANNNLGTLMGSTGRMTDAVAIYERVHPKPVAWQLMGQLYRQAGDQQQALACYQFAHSLDPAIRIPAFPAAPEAMAPATIAAASPAAAVPARIPAEMQVAMAAPALQPVPAVPPVAESEIAVETEIAGGAIEKVVAEISATDVTSRSATGPAVPPASLPVGIEPARFSLPDVYETIGNDAGTAGSVTNDRDAMPSGSRTATQPAASSRGQQESPGWAPRTSSAASGGMPSAALPPASKVLTGSAVSLTQVATVPVASRTPAQPAVLAEVHPGWSPRPEPQSWGMQINARVPAATVEPATANVPGSPVMMTIPAATRVANTSDAVGIESTAAIVHEPAPAREVRANSSRPSGKVPEAEISPEVGQQRATVIPRAQSPDTELVLDQLATPPSIRQATPAVIEAVAARAVATGEPESTVTDDSEVTTIAFEGVSRLEEICLVELTDEQRLTPVTAECRAECHGQMYHFSSEAAAEKFRQNPGHYLPVAGGLDVVGIREGTQVEPGELTHAAWFRHRLYVFTSADHLEQFRHDPHQYQPPRPVLEPLSTAASL